MASGEDRETPMRELQRYCGQSTGQRGHQYIVNEWITVGGGMDTHDGPFDGKNIAHSYICQFCGKIISAEKFESK